MVRPESKMKVLRNRELESDCPEEREQELVMLGVSDVSEEFLLENEAGVWRASSLLPLLCWVDIRKWFAC